MKRFSHLWLMAVCICLLFQSELSAAKEHQRFKIKSTEIEGNRAFSDRRLYRTIISRPSIFLKPSYYYPDIFIDDLKNIEMFYHRNGYLEAQVVGHEVRLDSLKRRADIRIEVSEGELTRVDGVSCYDNQVFNDREILTLVKLKPGDPLVRKKIDDATVAILTLCAERGYLDASVKPDIRVDTTVHLATVDYLVQEKIQYTIDSIRIAGADKTRLKIIRRELDFKHGEIINYSRLLESQRNLYLTGLFQSAYVRPVPPESGAPECKDILIETKESKSRELNFSVGYGSLEQIRTRVGMYNNNWNGTARKLGLTGKLSFINRGVEATFTEPWTFGTRWRSDLALTIDYLEEPGYNQLVYGGRVTVGRKLPGRLSTNLTYRHQSVDLSNVRVSTFPAEIATRIRSLKLTVIHDSRDNLFNPSRGLYVEPSLEAAGVFRGAADLFTRLELKGKYFQPVGWDVVSAHSLEVGWMDSPRDLDGIPLNERLYAGGPSTLRAFKYRRVGPLDPEGYPTGGRFKLILNAVELRRPVYKWLGMVLFFDAGNVWNRPQDIRMSELRLSPGLGLRANTFLGLVRVDFGLNIDPRPSEPPGMIYFSVGQAF